MPLVGNSTPGLLNLLSLSPTLFMRTHKQRGSMLDLCERIFYAETVLFYANA